MFPNRIVTVYILVTIVLSTSTNHNFDYVLKLFGKCHFKVLNGESELDSYILSKLLLNINLFHYSSVLSIQQSKTNEDRNSFQNYAGLPRFTVCFVHLYMEVSLSFERKDYTTIRTTMRNLRISGEWPDHFIFIGNYKNLPSHAAAERLSFYNQELHNTFARGLILTMECTTLPNLNCKIHYICVFCPSSIKPFEMNHKIPLRKLANRLLHTWLEKDNRGILVGGLNKNQILNLQNECFMLATSLTIRIRRFYYSSICIFHILNKKFNYNFTYSIDFQSRPGDVAQHYFMATNAILISKSSHRITMRWKNSNWVPYGLLQTTLKFLAFKKIPELTTETLFLKPCDTSTWGFLVVSVVLLALAQIPTSLLTFWKFVEIFVFTCLEQSVNYMPSTKFQFTYQFQQVCWLLWLLITLVFVNGYKGFIFVLFSTTAQVDFPKSVLDLTKDTSYLITTYEAVRAYKNKKFIAIPIVHQYVNERSNDNDSFAELVALRNSHIYHIIEHPARFIAGTIWKNKFSASTESVPGGFVFNNITYQNFAFIFEETDLSFVPTVMREVVTSAPTKILGFDTQTPWYVYRNFLHDRFVSHLAALEEGGFFNAFEANVRMGTACDSIVGVFYTLKYNYNVSEEKLNFRASAKRCISKVVAEYLRGASIQQTQEPIPLTVSYLRGIFIIALIVTAAICPIFVIEKVSKAFSAMSVMNINT